MCKWDDLWRHSLNQISQQAYKKRYLGEFAAETIKT